MAQSTLDPREVSAPPPARAWTTRLSIPAWVAPLAIMLLGFALRLYQFDRLSLWLDEIYVVDYARLPWRDVLGFNGAYDNHPPLYFALVKLANLVSAEVNGLRYLSIVTGTLTIPVVYVLTKHLVNRNAALLASLIFALSPLHIWYSQEGRMYAPTMLTIALSYYALLRFLQQRHRGWATAYGLSVVIAMYLDYSALYALAPQAVVVLALAWGSWKTVRDWIIVVMAAGLLYVPWIREILNTLSTIEQRDFLFVTWEKIVSSFFTIIGLPGDNGYYWGFAPMPWTDWPGTRPVIVAVVFTIFLLSAVTLSGRYRPALIVGTSLLFGTIAVAALISYFVSPGYADRTVSYGLIGWAILAGSVAFGRVPNGGRPLALAGVGLLMVFSLIALRSIQVDGGKEDYRGLARQAAVGIPFDIPLYADWLNATALTTYEPDLTPRPSSEIRPTPAMWLAYSDNEWVDTGAAETQERLREEGYERVTHLPFFPLLNLDLYLHRQAAIGTEVPLPPWQTILPDGRLGLPWAVTPRGTEVEIDDDGESLRIFSNAEQYATVEYLAAARAGYLYLSEITAETDLSVGTFYASLQCESVSGAPTGVSSAEFGGDEMAGAGRTIRLAVICEEETSQVRLVFGNTGVSSVELRAPRLSEVSPDDPLRLDSDQVDRWPNWGTP